MQFQLIPCWQAPRCARTFYTAHEMYAHHLDAHERALPRPAVIPEPSPQHTTNGAVGLLPAPLEAHHGD